MSGETGSVKSGRVIYHTHCCWCRGPSLEGKEFCSYGAESCATKALKGRAGADKYGFPRTTGSAVKDDCAG